MDDAATGVDHRALRLRERKRCRTNRHGIGQRSEGEPGQRTRVRFAGRDRRPRDVGRHVDEHGPGPSAARDRERLVDRRRNIARALAGDRVLDDRRRHADHVGLLERVGPAQVRADLARDRDQRHGVHLRVGERRYEVRRPGARGDERDADAAARAAYPSAARPAAASWRTRTWRRPLPCRASWIGRLAPPGSPNSTSTPSAARARIRASAARMRRLEFEDVLGN